MRYRERRHPEARDVHVQYLGHDDTVRLLNVSTGGASLSRFNTLPEPLEDSIITFVTRAGKRVQARVVWVDEETFGVEFISTFKNELLKEITGHFSRLKA